MAMWRKETFELKEGHGWKAASGYKIFVGGGGTVRFDVPQELVCLPDSDFIKFYDQIPKEDARCTLAVSWSLLAPVDWSGLSISRLVQEAVASDEREILVRGTTICVQRPDVKLAWTEIRFIDINERREARSRICIGRGTEGAVLDHDGLLARGRFSARSGVDSCASLLGTGNPCPGTVQRTGGAMRR